MIRDFLVPALRASFPGSAFSFSHDQNLIASLPSPCAEVGLLSIYDHDDEATVEVSSFGHSHFSCYLADLTLQDREQSIVEDVVRFLQALFADKVLLFRSLDRRSDGWKRLDLLDEAPALRSHEEYYLWSGPYGPAARFLPTNK
jgi:hypothetical protein